MNINNEDYMNTLEKMNADARLIVAKLRRIMPQFDIEVEMTTHQAEKNLIRISVYTKKQYVMCTTELVHYIPFKRYYAEPQRDTQNLMYRHVIAQIQDLLWNYLTRDEA